MVRSVSADTPGAPPELAAVPLLSALPPDALAELSPRALARTYEPSEVVRRQGSPAKHVVLLLEGAVSATAVAANGRLVTFGRFSAPCALDKLAVIDGAGHTATFTAVARCLTRSLPGKDFLSLIDDVRAIRRHVLTVLAATARDRQNRYVSAVTLPVSARLAGWLLREASRAGTTAILIPGGQAELASHFGVTRVSINRALSALRSEGIIAVSRDQITLLAPELLSQRALPG